VNRSPELLDALRAEIQMAPLADLPAIGGGLEALRLEIRIRLSQAVPVPAAAAAQDGDRLLDAQEAAERLNQTPRWVRAHKDELPRVVLPGDRSLRFSGRKLELFIKRRLTA